MVEVMQIRRVRLRMAELDWRLAGAS